MSNRTERLNQIDEHTLKQILKQLESDDISSAKGLEDSQFSEQEIRLILKKLSEQTEEPTKFFGEEFSKSLHQDFFNHKFS